MRANYSRDYGRKFEDNLHGYLTNFLKKYACIGACYKMHDRGAGYQPIDLLIDSKELGLKRTKNLDLDTFKNFVYERCNT